MGTGGANYFGVNMTKAMGLARDLDRPLDADQDFGRGAIWDTLSDDIANANIPPPPMGLAVSRPVLTHVRVRDQIKAAVIAGCGDDTFEGTAGLAMSDGAGRCVMVLDATTGALIRKFGFLDNFAMTYPFTGSPVAYPADGVAPADRAYIGDRQGRLWRMDLRAADPADWTIEIAFPLIVQGQVDPDQAIGYELGREVVDRPSLSLRADGGLVVVFGTGERSVAGGTGRSFMVSFTDRPRVDADGDVAFEVTPNWVMPLGNNERATGATIVRSETAYFTTRQAVEGDGCAEAVGRLYGIHSYFRYTDADGAPDTFQASDGRDLDVVPALTQFGANGEPLGQKGLSIILPEGRVAYGLAITRTPSCVDGQAASTDLILNLADESAGGQAGIQGEAAANSSKLEVVENDAVRELPLRGRVFARGQGVEFDLCLDCKPDGTVAVGATGGSLTPFPTEVMYWGSTFLN
ncbi:MAG: PilC/PilY family type IV pilus protein [bacterium]